MLCWGPRAKAVSVDLIFIGENREKQAGELSSSRGSNFRLWGKALKSEMKQREIKKTPPKQGNHGFYIYD